MKGIEDGVGLTCFMAVFLLEAISHLVGHWLHVRATIITLTSEVKRNLQEQDARLLAVNISDLYIYHRS